MKNWVGKVANERRDNSLAGGEKKRQFEIQEKSD
jgi:hypothetical protein